MPPQSSKQTWFNLWSASLWPARFLEPWPRGVIFRAVSYRIDDQKPTRALWFGQGRFIVGLLGGKKSISLIKRLASAEKFVFWAGHGPAGKVNEIRLEGLAKHLQKVRNACGW